MIRTILTVLDDSKASKLAAEYGLRLAKAHGARVIGLGALDEPSICRPSYEPLGGGAFREARNKALLEEARSKAQMFLNEFIDMAAEAGVGVETFLRPGDPGDEIMNGARVADLVVVSRNAHFHFETEDPPDTLLKLLPRTPRPIIAIPPRIDPGKGVLVAYDNSVTASRALQMFVSVGPAYQGKVHVMGLADEFEEAQKMIGPALDYLRRCGIEAEALPMATKARASKVICEEAARLSVELIVMGSRGHGFVKELFVGSTAEELVGPTSKLEVPVFVYH